MYTFVVGSGRLLTSIVVVQPYIIARRKKLYYVATPAEPRYLEMTVQGLGPIDIPLFFAAWRPGRDRLVMSETSTLCQTTDAPAAFHYTCNNLQDVVWVVDIGVDTAKVAFTAGRIGVDEQWTRTCIVVGDQPAKYLKGNKYQQPEAE